MINSHTQYLNNVGNTEITLLLLYEDKAKYFANTRISRWEKEALTSIHKSYNHANSIVIQVNMFNNFQRGKKPKGTTWLRKCWKIVCGKDI